MFYNFFFSRPRFVGVGMEDVMHPYIVEMMARENQRRISEEMHMLHMSRRIKKSRPPFNGRLLLTLGEWMIQIGERMKRRYAPFTPSALEARS